MISDPYERTKPLMEEDFTKRELVKAIANWIDAEVNNVKDWQILTDALREGTWLRYYNGEV